LFTRAAGSPPRALVDCAFGAELESCRFKLRPNQDVQECHWLPKQRAALKTGLRDDSQGNSDQMTTSLLISEYKNYRTLLNLPHCGGASLTQNIEKPIEVTIQ